ncbi:MAG: right-handed parallel beta-helix repeat-containing protein [Bacteroidales bacterium]
MKKTLLLSFAYLMANSLFAADFTVTNPAGDSSTEGSFLHALVNSASGDVINFDVEGGVISPFATVTIENKNLTINGLNKKDNKKIKFEKGDKVLDIKGGVVSVNNCIFSDKTNQAIFIQNSGTLNIDNCEFLNNKTTATGGCIGVSTLCTANITNSVFDGNKGANGGCFRIYNQATLNMTGCTLLNNRASQSGGCIYVYTTAAKDYQANINLENSTFIRNQAGDRGGVVYAYSRYADNTKPLVTTVVNCSFTGNYSTKNIGGAICIFSNSDCASKLVMVNSIMAGNAGGLIDGAYFVPQDICIYDGNVDDSGNVYPRTYLWDLKNNILGVLEKTADDKQINNKKLNVYDNSNIEVTDFAKANIYGEIYRLDNSFNEDMEDGDIMYAPTLAYAGSMPIAMISAGSIAKGAGIASYANVTVPKTDQLGKARPASPSIGAVEFGDVTGISSIKGGKDIKLWSDGMYLHTTLTEGVVLLYTTTGQLVKQIPVGELNMVSLKPYAGSVLIAKVVSGHEVVSTPIVIR